MIVITVLKLDSGLDPRSGLSRGLGPLTQVNIRIKIVIIIVLKT
jgi:hypothetical protein